MGGSPTAERCRSPERPTHAGLPQERLRSHASSTRSSSRPGIPWCWASVSPRRGTSTRSSGTRCRTTRARPTRWPARSPTSSRKGPRSRATSSRRSSISGSTKTSRGGSSGTAPGRSSPRGRIRLNFRFAMPGGAATLNEPAASRFSGGTPTHDKARGRKPRASSIVVAATRTCPKIFESFGVDRVLGPAHVPGSWAPTRSATSRCLPTSAAITIPARRMAEEAEGSIRIRRPASACALPNNPNPQSRYPARR